MIKYIVKQGYVVSNNDLQEHFITADVLIRLYGVSRKDCVIAPINKKGFRNLDGLIELKPDSTGNYKIPTQ